MQCKIFISSTFKDMQEERDIIRNEVIPEVEQYALSYGVTIDIVDLRWGINTDECENSDQSSVKILKTCFDEINDCKPFFIGILGQRYGWIPNLSNVKSAIDPEYYNKVSFDNKSVTEYEIEYALESYNDELSAFIFCIREEINGDLTEDQRKTYISDSDDDLFRLELLRNKIKDKCANQYFSYNAKVKEDGHLNLESFKLQLVERLKKAIDERFSNYLPSQNNLEKEIILQEALYKQKNAVFSGRDDILNKINQFYDGTENILGIYGISGIGKTSIIAHLIEENKKNSDAITLFFMAGVSSESNFVHNMIASFIYQLSNYLNASVDDTLFQNQYVQDNYEEILNSFYLLLTEVCKLNRVYIFIDALDQFSNKDEKEVIDWINVNYFNLLGKNIKLVFSYIPSDKINKEIIKKRIGTLEIGGISRQDILSISKNILMKHKKTITDNCYQILMEKKNNDQLCCSNPLYLSLLLQEIINFDASDFNNIYLIQEKENIPAEAAIYLYVQRTIEEAPVTLKEEFLSLIFKVNEKITNSFVTVTMAIIAISRRGVREKDVYGIYNQMDLSYNAADFSYLKKLFRLFIRENNGFIDFSHKILDEILEELFFNDEKELALRINQATLGYTLTLADDDSFKQKELLYYAYLVKDENAFSWYLKNNINDLTIFKSFCEVYSQFMDKEESSDLFFVGILTMDNIILKDFLAMVKMQEMGYHLKEKLLLDILIANKNISLENNITIYFMLFEINYHYKNVNYAYYYANIIKKMLLLQYKKETKFHSILMDFYVQYKELLYSMQRIFSVYFFIKRIYILINKEISSDNMWIKKEYLKALKKINKLRYNSSIKKNDCSYELLNDYNNFSEWNNWFTSLSFEEVYLEKEKLNLFRDCAIKENRIDEYEKMLKKYLSDVKDKLIRNDNISFLRIEGFLYRQLGDIYLYSKKINQAQNMYENSMDVYKIIAKVSDLSDDVFEYAESTYCFEKLTNSKNNEAKNIYKAYNKYKKFHVDFYTSLMNNILMISLLLFVFFAIIVGSIVVVNRIYILASEINMFVENVYYQYIFNNLEILIFMTILPIVYSAFSFFHLLNRYHPITQYWRNKFIQFGLFFGISTIFFAGWNIYYFSITKDLNEIVFEYLFTLYNSIASGFLITYSLYSIKKMLTHSFQNDIEKKLHPCKNKIISVIDLSFLFIILLANILILSMPNVFTLWHEDSTGALTMYLILAVNIIAIIIAFISKIFSRRNLYEMDKIN